MDIPQKQGKTIVFTDGVYDGFHYGHARQLEQAKKCADNVWLIVGVNGQEDVEKHKGKTIYSGLQRKQMVQHCKWTDQVIYPSPWVLDQQFLNKHKIDYVCHDDIPYKGEKMDDVYALVKRLGKFKATQRTEGVSTTDLINQIHAAKYQAACFPFLNEYWFIRVHKTKTQVDLLQKKTIMKTY